LLRTASGARNAHSASERLTWTGLGAEHASPDGTAPDALPVLPGDECAYSRHLSFARACACFLFPSLSRSLSFCVCARASGSRSTRTDGQAARPRSSSPAARPPSARSRRSVFADTCAHRACDRPDSAPCRSLALGLPPSLACARALP
jgi:hypothetical protein